MLVSFELKQKAIKGNSNIDLYTKFDDTLRDERYAQLKNQE